MNKINVFETFAGIGSQNKALKRVQLSQKEVEFKVVYTSEWYTDAIIGYDAIHHLQKKLKKNSKEELFEYLSKFTFSKDSKSPINDIKRKIWANEDYYQKLYWANKANKNLGDITSINSSMIKEKIDLITYSFPCQDLSIAGKGKGMSEDSNTRSSLLWHIKRILTELSQQQKLPKYLLMENVKAIKNKKHVESLNVFKQELKNLGYKSFEFIENAIDHGIPQKRERFFMLSILDYQKDLPMGLEYFYTKKVKKLNSLIDWDNMAFTNRWDQYVKNIEEQIINDAEGINPLKRKFKNLAVYPSFNQANIVHGIDSDFISTITFSGENSRLRILNKNASGKYEVRKLSGLDNLLLMGFDRVDYSKMIAMGLSEEKIRGFAGNSIVVNILESIFKLICEIEKENNE